MSGKITLTSSTKTSLHERFTKLAAVSKTNSAPISKPAFQARNTASQLALRPTMQAALKIKNKTFKQRLGTLNQYNPVNVGGQLSKNNSFKGKPNRQNLKSRLGVPNNSGNANPGRVGARLNNRLSFNPRPMRTQQQQIGALKRSLSAPKLMANTRIRFNQNKNTNVINKVNRVRNPKLTFKNKNKSPMVKNLKGKMQKTGFNKNFNAMNKNKAPTNIKKSLDMDLDQYMSKTKSHLDNDLDSYMAKSKSHLDADLDTYMAQTTTTQ